MELRPAVLPDDLPALDNLFEACHIADGHWPLGEHKYLDLVRGGLGEAFGIIGEEAGASVAYAHLTPNQEHGRWSLEIAIHPLARRLDVVETISRAAIEAVRRRGGTGLRLWVFQPALAETLHDLGFAQERELRQLRRPLPPSERPRFPASVSVRPFRVGEDEGAWLALNNQAFQGHPENGAWDREVLADRIRTPWFEPGGFRTAWEGDALVGFCWTKLHPGRLGEIYVIAVDPARQGRGLGRALTLDGLWYLFEQGDAITGMLYVDAANTVALGLYEGLGFYLDHVDRAFVLEFT